MAVILPLASVVPNCGLTAPQAPVGLALLMNRSGSPATAVPPVLVRSVSEHVAVLQTLAVTVALLVPSALRLAGVAVTATVYRRMGALIFWVRVCESLPLVFASVAVMVQNPDAAPAV